MTQPFSLAGPVRAGRGIRVAISFLCFLMFIAGPLGFSYFENWSLFESLYTTVITITTVGYGDHSPVTTGGRLVSMSIVLLGLGTMSYVLVQVTAFIMEGHLNTYFRQRKVDQMVKELQDHYIVCGVGHTGSHVVDELIREQVPFVVVDNDPKIKDDPRLKDHAFIVGDATDDEVLKKAGIEKAKGIATALHEDEKNLFLVITARNLNPRLRIVAKTLEDRSGQKMQLAGANFVVFTDQIGARRLSNQLLRPHAADFLDVMARHDQDPSFEEVTLPPTSRWIGKTLGELGLQARFNLHPVAIRAADGRYAVGPSGDHKIIEGETLVVICKGAHVKKVRDWVQG